MIEFSGNSVRLSMAPVRRECPHYHHLWYTQKADWIVMEIGVDAAFDSADFKESISSHDLARLRQQVADVSIDKAGCFEWTCQSHRCTTTLVISVDLDERGHGQATLQLDQSLDSVQFKYRFDIQLDDLTVLIQGLDKFAKQFPILAESQTAEGRPADGKANELFLECEGRCLAILSDPRFDDMFWTSFKVTPIVEHDTVLNLLSSNRVNELKEETVYRLVHCGDMVPNAFPSIEGIVEGRLRLRGV